MESEEECTWCGETVAEAEGYRAYEPAGERRAAFCRLEHLIPWMMQGPRWEPGGVEEPAGIADPGFQADCSHCGEPIGDAGVLLVRHRGEHRVADRFCSADHMAEWAKAGGRWR